MVGNLNGKERVPPMQKERSKTAKRAAAGAAGAVTAASLLVNTVVTDPATLIKPDGESVSDPSHVCVVDGVEHRSYIVETDRDEPFTLRERICLRIQSWPLPVRALILLPLWGIGELLIALATASGTRRSGRSCCIFCWKPRCLSDCSRSFGSCCFRTFRFASFSRAKHSRG